MINTFQNLSLKHKLMIIILLTSGIVLFVTAPVFVVSEAISFHKSARDNLTILAGIVGKNVTAALMFNDEKAASDILNGLSSNPHIIAAYVVTSDGRLFAQYCTNGTSKGRIKFGCGKDGDARKIGSKQLEYLVETSRSYWKGVFEFNIVNEIIFDGQGIGTVIMQADAEELLSRLSWLSFIFAGVCLAVFLIAYLLSARLQKLISGPITRLTQTMGSVSKDKDYSRRMQKESNDEIGLLMDGFNAMLEQIHLRDEKVRQHSEELRDMNEEVKNFAYIVSHDLRAPLVSIRGFTEELRYALKDIDAALTKCLPQMDDQERERVTMISRKDVPVAMEFISSSVTRMDGQINAILKLSRLGRRELKPEPVDMTALTKSILHSLAHQIEERRVAVTVGELPTATADRFALEQIMGNLLDNALKYLEPGRDGAIAVTAENGPDGTTFRIRDNGRGIATDDMHKVFELFRRAGKQDVPGEGMGLAYVKTLVRRHGGRIWCESEPGEGTTFSFTIPSTAMDMV